MKLKIDKGVPISRKRDMLRKYPFDEMDVGDSFFVKCDDAKRGAVQSAIGARCAQLGIRATTRRQPGGVRVWLVSKTRARISTGESDG